MSHAWFMRAEAKRLSERMGCSEAAWKMFQVIAFTKEMYCQRAGPRVVQWEILKEIKPTIAVPEALYVVEKCYEVLEAWEHLYQMERDPFFGFIEKVFLTLLWRYRISESDGAIDALLSVEDYLSRGPEWWFDEINVVFKVIWDNCRGFSEEETVGLTQEFATGWLPKCLEPEQEDRRI